MSVVIVLEGATSGHFTVAVSPLAELAASLHVLTEHGHHADHAPWAEEITRASPPAFRAGLRRFSPLWSALRWRGFYTGLDRAAHGRGPNPGPAAQTDALARLPLEQFAELTAYACASGYRGFNFTHLLHDPTAAAALRHTASGLATPHLDLAEDLLRAPETLRSDLLAFLDLCHPVYFDALWAETEPCLTRAAHHMRQQLTDAGPETALSSLSPSSTPQARPSPSSSPGGPKRIIFDKLHHSVITPARTPVLLVPSRYGAPHLIVKNEPGLPPVLHFPIDTPEVGVTLARSRLLALTDPRRVRLCRLIARQSMTTTDLANRLSMTRPQISRHLRTLRDLGLVTAQRNGRFVHYGLDLTAVERIGRDVATALQY